MNFSCISRKHSPWIKFQDGPLFGQTTSSPALQWCKLAYNSIAPVTNVLQMLRQLNINFTYKKLHAGRAMNSFSALKKI